MLNCGEIWQIYEILCQELVKLYKVMTEQRKGHLLTPSMPSEGSKMTNGIWKVWSKGQTSKKDQTWAFG